MPDDKAETSILPFARKAVPNDAVTARMRGVPAQPVTAESDADPRNPNMASIPCPCGEDTIRGCAARPARHCGNSERALPPITPGDLRARADEYDDFDRRAGTLKVGQVGGGAAILREAAAEIERLRAALSKVAGY